jgi:hypothetical protein
MLHNNASWPAAGAERLFGYAAAATGHGDLSS